MINSFIFFLLILSSIIVLKLYKKSSYVLVLFSIFFITSIWRLSGAFLIDFQDPVYSEELHKYVGGSYGAYVSILLSFFVIVLLAIYLIFDKKKKYALSQILHIKNTPLKINGIQVEYIILLFLFVLYASVIIETIIIGKYPLLDGIPRWQYGRHIAGPIVKTIFPYFIGLGAFLHGYLYIFFKYKQNNSFNVKLVILLIIMQGFIFIAHGNKFTTPLFTLLITLSVISVGLVYKNKQRINITKVVLGIVFILSLSVILMYKLYIIERGYSDEYLLHFLYGRIFVAPNQLNYDAIQRVVFDDISGHLDAFYYLFIDKLPMDSNPSVNYLMFKSLGPSVLMLDTSFTDAYPGVTIELIGIVGSLVFSVILALIYALSAYNMLYYTAMGRVFESTLFFFVFQASMQYHNQGQFFTILLFVKLLIVYMLIVTVKKKTQN